MPQEKMPNGAGGEPGSKQLHIMHFLHITGSKQFNMPLDK